MIKINKKVNHEVREAAMGYPKLKMFSFHTPTSGSVHVNGRIASLLELRGFRCII
jgi:hypothetical protein